MLTVVIFYLTIWGKRGQCPWLYSQELHVSKILVAHQLKIAALRLLKRINTWKKNMKNRHIKIKYFIIGYPTLNLEAWEALWENMWKSRLLLNRIHWFQGRGTLKYKAPPKSSYIFFEIIKQSTGTRVFSCHFNFTLFWQMDSLTWHIKYDKSSQWAEVRVQTLSMHHHIKVKNVSLCSTNKHRSQTYVLLWCHSYQGA